MGRLSQNRVTWGWRGERRPLSPPHFPNDQYDGRSSMHPFCWGGVLEPDGDWLEMKGRSKAWIKKRQKGESPLVLWGVMGLDTGEMQEWKDNPFSLSPLCHHKYSSIQINGYFSWDLLISTINPIDSCNLECTMINLHNVTWRITAILLFLLEYSKGGSSHRERGWSLGNDTGIFCSLMTQTIVIIFIRGNQFLRRWWDMCCLVASHQ